MGRKMDTDEEEDILNAYRVVSRCFVQRRR